MSKRPFFSILLPTKNRSHLVGFAVQSILEQTFGDFEIILVDNDDSDTATRDAAASFSDPRLKYFRTGGLSMPDNWEFALSKSTGKYITVLEDKQAFYPHALEIIRKSVSEYDAKVIRWYNDLVDDTFKTPVFVKKSRTNSVSRYSSDEILQEYVEGSTDRKLPDLINSCVSRELVDLIQKKMPPGRFFIDVSPDICAAFMQLNYESAIIQIDSSLCIMGALSLSNATRARIKSAGHKQYFGIANEDIFHSHVPIKSRSMVNSVIYNDYLRIREMLGGRLRKFTMSPRVYLILCLKDIIRNRSLGGDIKEDLSLWKEYLRAQDPSVRKGIALAALKIVLKSYIRKYAYRVPIFSKLIFRLLNSGTRLTTDFVDVLNLTKDRRFQVLPENLVTKTDGLSQ